MQSPTASGTLPPGLTSPPLGPPIPTTTPLPPPVSAGSLSPPALPPPIPGIPPPGSVPSFGSPVSAAMVSASPVGSASNAAIMADPRRAALLQALLQRRGAGFAGNMASGFLPSYKTLTLTALTSIAVMAVSAKTLQTINASTDENRPVDANEGTTMRWVHGTLIGASALGIVLGVGGIVWKITHPAGMFM